MDIHLAQKLQVHQIMVDPPLPITALDGQSLGEGKVTYATVPLCL